jgi:hypothetical protein
MVQYVQSIKQDKAERYRIQASFIITQSYDLENVHLWFRFLSALNSDLKAKESKTILQVNKIT